MRLFSCHIYVLYGVFLILLFCALRKWFRRFTLLTFCKNDAKAALYLNTYFEKKLLLFCTKLFEKHWLITFNTWSAHRLVSTFFFVWEFIPCKLSITISISFMIMVQKILVDVNTSSFKAELSPWRSTPENYRNEIYAKTSIYISKIHFKN